MIVCEPNPGADTFHERPAIIIEVLSESTRRHDGIEKRSAYLTIPSLQYYLQMEPDHACVLIDARGDKSGGSTELEPTTRRPQVVLNNYLMDAGMPLAPQMTEDDV